MKQINFKLRHIRKSRAKLVALIAAFVLFFALFFLWGILTVHSKIFPYIFLKQIYFGINFRSNVDPHSYLNLSTKCIADGNSLFFDTYSIRVINQKVPFAVRDGAGAIYFKDNLYLIGGWNPYDKKNFPRIT